MGGRGATSEVGRLRVETTTRAWARPQGGEAAAARGRGFSPAGPVLPAPHPASLSVFPASSPLERFPCEAQRGQRPGKAVGML